MGRYIDAEALYWEIRNSGCFEIAKHIKQYPVADVKPVVHAHWIEDKADMDCGVPVIFGYSCSNCNGTDKHKGNYCPNCGAKMDEGAEE